MNRTCGLLGLAAAGFGLAWSAWAGGIPEALFIVDASGSMAVCASAQGPAPLHTNVPIYFTIVIHNEENEPYDDNLELFRLHRIGLVDFVTMLASNGAALNWQSDWRFLEAVRRHDEGTPETDGLNIVAWMDAQGVECDPHAHATVENLADVAFRLEALGAGRSGVVGGFVAAPPSASILDEVSGPITGAVNPSFVWTPALLWGGATAGHVDETNLWASGIWRPASHVHFMRHAEDPGALPHVGGFGGKQQRWDNVLRLIEWRTAGMLATGRLYSATVFYSQGELTPPNRAEADQRLKTLSGIPNVHGVGLAQLQDIWEGEFGSRATILPYDLTGDVDADGLPDEWEVRHGFDISWTDGRDDQDADGDGVSDAKEYIADTDPRDPADVFRVLAIDPGPPAVVRFRPGAPERRYSFQHTDDLEGGSWVDVPGVAPRPGEGEGAEREDEMADENDPPVGPFYRVEVDLP